MTYSFARSRQARKMLRQALSGAAVSLSLAALSPDAQAITFFCDDDLTNNNFACGDHASVTGTNATAVGDDPAAVTSGTALGSNANAAGEGGTAVGFLARADSSAVAVGSGSAVFGANGTALGSNALSNANGTAVGSDALTDANGTAVGNSANAGHAGSGAITNTGARPGDARRLQRCHGPRPTLERDGRGRDGGGSGLAGERSIFDRGRLFCECWRRRWQRRYNGDWRPCASRDRNRPDQRHRARRQRASQCRERNGCWPRRVGPNERDSGRSERLRQY